MSIDISQYKDIRIPSGQNSSEVIFDLVAGEHDVEVLWDNRNSSNGQCEIELKGIGLRSDAVDKMADINGDGMVDNRDIDSWYELVPYDGKVYVCDQYFIVPYSDGSFDVYDQEKERRGKDIPERDKGI